MLSLKQENLRLANIWDWSLEQECTPYQPFQEQLFICILSLYSRLLKDFSKKDFSFLYSPLLSLRLFKKDFSSLYSPLLIFYLFKKDFSSLYSRFWNFSSLDSRFWEQPGPVLQTVNKLLRRTERQIVSQGAKNVAKCQENTCFWCTTTISQHPKMWQLSKNWGEKTKKVGECEGKTCFWWTIPATPQ